MELVLASNNAGKIAEIQYLLREIATVRSMREIGFTDTIEEPYETFEENAYIKAQTVHKHCALPVLADDSGLCVDELDGAPGVFSARYSGEGATDDGNNTKLLGALSGCDLRQAHYVAVLCLILPHTGGIHYFEGKCFGHISYEPRGTGGFGYDPLFVPDGYMQTFGELPIGIKSEISHRAKAMKELLAFLQLMRNADIGT
jgi:XTP/dITP diphosphohydrolase